MAQGLTSDLVATARLDRHYLLYGLGMTITGDHAAVIAALHARLRRFSTDVPAPAAMTFAFECLAEGDADTVVRPSEPTRLVYAPPGGEVLYAPRVDQLYIRYEGQLAVLSEPSRGYTQISARGWHDRTLWLLSHPMFTVPLVEVLKRRGFFSVHAAGVSINGRGLLLAGKSGSGKSTLALALLKSGLPFMGDDTIFLTSRSGDLEVLSFPDEIDVTDDTARLVPGADAMLSLPKRSGWTKRQVWAEDVPGVQLATESRPGALVFPRVARAERSVLTAMPKEQALLELAPNVLLTHPQSSQAHLDALAKLVAQSDCYSLQTGRDFDALIALLVRLVS
jgi:HPr Serine kinase C-terminal domain